MHRAGATEEQLAHITQEMYKQNHELSDKNKTLSLLRHIDEAVLTTSASKENNIPQLVCDLLVKEAQFSLAAIYLADSSKSYAGLATISSEEFIDDVTKQALKGQVGSVSILPQSGNAFSHAVATGTIQMLSSLKSVNPSLPDETDVHLMTVLSTGTLFACPLKGSGGHIGVLLLGSPDAKNDVPDYTKNLVDRLASTISIAVENHLLDVELQAATARLKIQNAKLKELDQTKDEFISMASHQLRTPLTTVKGYLSMILEGDIGQVDPKQKELIQRAFDGANKMVYLISDLLNVSRLQSGKFVIDNKPTDLPKVVESEINQLLQQAKTRGVELIYNKPAAFPTLNLDENKMRQVVMNFADNALYYTPKGGKVTVNLEATDQAINFTVTDNGLGVPKEVQPQLFSKFYRAENARKMRPDGTGLGLFMAKKVIVAQGGAIIFKSQEGKGSTFGFSLPRATTEIKTP